MFLAKYRKSDVLCQSWLGHLNNTIFVMSFCKNMFFGQTELPGSRLHRLFMSKSAEAIGKHPLYCALSRN